MGLSPFVGNERIEAQTKICRNSIEESGDLSNIPSTRETKREAHRLPFSNFAHLTLDEVSSCERFRSFVISSPRLRMLTTRAWRISPSRRSCSAAPALSTELSVLSFPAPIFRHPSDAL